MPCHSAILTSLFSGRSGPPKMPKTCCIFLKIVISEDMVKTGCKTLLLVLTSGQKLMIIFEQKKGKKEKKM